MKQNKKSQILKNYLIRFILCQMSERENIKKYGDLAIRVLCKEIQKLHEREVFLAANSEKFTREQKKKTLNIMSFIKEKRDLTIKG